MSSPSDWIKIENGKPSEGKEVLVYREIYDSYNDEIKGLIEKDMMRKGKWYNGNFVTHWMPLPEPPNE